MNRLRLVGAVIQLEVVLDDGDTLERVPVEPVRLSARDLEQFDVTAVLDQLAGQMKLDPHPPAQPLSATATVSTGSPAPCS